MSDRVEDMIVLEAVRKAYQRGSETTDVLKHLSLQVPAGQFLVLMGPSGSGKTTLLNIIGGLDRPTDGAVRVAGQRVDRLSSTALAHWRAEHIGFVFQLYHLLPMLTAVGNVELPLLLRNLPRKERRRRAAIALSLVGVEHRSSHYPRELSGGQEQRVGIARAIVTDPPVLLCDEPTGDLDRKAGNEILSLLRALNREHGKTIVMVTHDPQAAEFGDRVVHLDKGQLAEAAA